MTFESLVLSGILVKIPKDLVRDAFRLREFADAAIPFVFVQRGVWEAYFNMHCSEDTHDHEVVRRILDWLSGSAVGITVLCEANRSRAPLSLDIEANFAFGTTTRLVRLQVAILPHPDIRTHPAAIVIGYPGDDLYGAYLRHWVH